MHYIKHLAEKIIFRLIDEETKNVPIKSKHDVVVLNSSKSDFKLENNCIYLADELIGKYECCVKIPGITGLMSETNTFEKIFIML